MNKKTTFKIIFFLFIFALLAVSLKLNSLLIKKYSSITNRHSPGDNVLITGKCVDRVSGKEIKLFQDQLLVREAPLEDEEFNGTVRSTGQDLNCNKSVIEKNLDVYQRHFARGTFLEKYFKEAQDNEIELIPMGKLVVDDSSVLSIRNQSLFLSGTCSNDKETVIINNEPVSVLSVDRTGEDYSLKVFKYRDSKKLSCNYKEVTYIKASYKEIELVKLKSLPVQDLKGKWVYVTGMCEGVEPTTGELFTYSLVSSLSKLIEIRVNATGNPISAVIGLKKENQILNCGDGGKKFVINPYLGVIDGREE